MHRLQVVIEVPEQLELEELSVEVGAGDISVAGLGRDDEIDNGADYDMDINCDVGNVDVIFEKR